MFRINIQIIKPFIPISIFNTDGANYSISQDKCLIESSFGEKQIE